MTKGYFAPCIHSEKNAPFIYINVLIALIPCIILSVVYYGLRALILLIASQVLFFFFDFVFSRFLRPNTINRDYLDISSVISGTIFALLLPPDTSIDVVILGVFVGSFVVKQLFGGVGTNLLNPAIAARLFVQIVVPGKLMGFSEPLTDFLKLDTLIDFSGRNGVMGDASSIYAVEVMAGSFATFIGIGSGIAIIIGAFYLLLKKIVRGYAFFGYLAGIILVFPLVHLSMFINGGGLKAFIVFFLTSGVLFFAIFVLGDFSTMPINPIMRMVVAFFCAGLTVFIYDKVDPITGLCAPVLLVNIATPSIDYYSGTLTHKEIVKKRAGDAT